MSIIQFNVAVPTDAGFLGRECNASECKKYFRVHVDSIQTQMHCPYCGTIFSNNELHTADQIDYLGEAAKEKAIEYAHREIGKMFDRLATSFRNSDVINITRTAAPYRAKQPRPQYSEHKVDSELKCPECNFLFQVFGVFGHCPGCNTENMLIYDANIAIIRQELAQSNNKRRSLRHAYNDLVSTFEHFCSKKSEQYAGDRPSFQDLFEARRYFKANKGIDILEGIAPSDNLVARRIFQKRNACQHAAGKINEKYIRKIPEDTSLLGTDADLSEDEFERGAKAIRDIIGRLAGGKLGG